MADTNEIALSVKNVSKTFRLPHERHSGLKSALVSKIGGKYRRGYEKQKVLNDVSFEVKKGEFFGIVGRNGSGKSTLLKLMAGIYVPDSGKVKVNGSLTPFIELGVGFNPELTGLENVYLNGALLGFSRKEMEAKYDDIVRFAELEAFMDQKLKNYSSGMQVRLAFAIAIQSDSDVLILDEVLAVGDEAFQRKCNDYFTRIKEDPEKTVILVTHSMESVKQYCDRAMMIREGEIVAIGDPVDVASEYSLANVQGEKKNTLPTSDSESVIQNMKLEILSPKKLDQTEPFRARVSFDVTQDIETSSLVYIKESDKKYTTSVSRSDVRMHKAGDRVSEVLTLDLSVLNDCTLSIGAEVSDRDFVILKSIPHDSNPGFIIRRKEDGILIGTALLHDRGSWEYE